MNEKQAITTSIRATSRASVKIKDSFYTFEFCEERQIVNPAEITEKELYELKNDLWNSCNEQVDGQIEEITNLFKNK